MSRQWVFAVWLPLALFTLLMFAAIASAQRDAPLISDELQVITAQNVSQIEALVSAGGDTKHISVSPDATMLAVASFGGSNFDISITDIQKAIEVNVIQGRMDSFRDLIWSPDSEQIAVISGRTTGAGVEERSVKTYTIRTRPNPTYYLLGNSDTWYVDYIYPADPPGNPVQLAWNPASDMIAIAFYERIEIYDVEVDTQLTSQPVAGIRSVEWSADGKLIITQSNDGTIRLWGVRATDG